MLELTTMRYLDGISWMTYCRLKLLLLKLALGKRQVQLSRSASLLQRLCKKPARLGEIAHFHRALGFLEKTYCVLHNCPAWDRLPPHPAAKIHRPCMLIHMHHGDFKIQQVYTEELLLFMQVKAFSVQHADSIYW